MNGYAKLPVLVTHGAGYLDRHLVRALADAGRTSVAVNDFPDHSTAPNGSGRHHLPRRAPVSGTVPLVQAYVGNAGAIPAIIARYGIDAANRRLPTCACIVKHLGSRLLP